MLIMVFYGKLQFLIFKINSIIGSIVILLMYELFSIISFYFKNKQLTLVFFFLDYIAINTFSLKFFFFFGVMQNQPCYKLIKFG